MTQTSKSLFANHYLQHRLPEHPEWQADPSDALAQLQALYNEKKALLPNFNEAQTEKDFLQPVLDILGFACTVQTSSSQAGKVQRPDYALFANAAQKAEADKHIKNEDAFYPRALAIAEAKYWERPLTKQHADSNRAQFDNRNPSHQIVSYLIGTGVDWGILTNGRFWRLYYRGASSTANEFYEVDLVELLESGDPEAFKTFWLFFRKEAFVKGKDGRNFLERVRDGSTTYARAVSDQLKDRVFDEVFPLLAGGFVADMVQRKEDPTTPAARALIKEATLSLLYKLLFLLYAEARDLLPLDNDGYRQQSITQLAQEVAQKIDQKATLGQKATNYYGRLLSLFKIIDQGDPAFGLPRYNGGLFHFTFANDADKAKHQANAFLDQHAINDGRLARALDNLARVDGQLVDYSFLEVRHLGAVYEGLLEYKLVIENAAAGQVHLATDKGERKATGSYYTPDYIVKYIVRHTLDPILAEREKQFADLMAQIAPKRARLQSLNLQSPISQSPATESRIKNEIYVLRRELEPLEKEAVTTLLDIKVCDPAMGSGHFLVEAVDYLTDRLIQILNQHPDHNPILTQLDAIRHSILDSMAEQAIPIDPARLDDTQLLQRTVMKRCIYGVDLNRMAVELAKLSLWLHSFTIGAPLSFLDHHLRWGNSLIGASARTAEQEMAQASGQLSLFGGPFKGLLRAAEVMRGISGLSDATLTEVEQSEALFREFDEAARPYKQLLDMRVAQHFGVKRAAEFLTLYGADAMKAGPDSVGQPYAEAMRQTRALFAQKRFFHWDLEFPEVFIDLDKADWKSSPGFDAVVGNPPYVRQEGLGADKPFFKEGYESYNGVADLYVYFLEQGARLLAEGGQFGNIVSNKFMRANYGQGIRQWLVQHTTLRQLVDFGELPVFAEAATFPLIILLEKSAPEKGQAVQVARIRRLDFASLDNEVADCSYLVNEAGLSEQGWSLAPVDVTKILQKMESFSISLGEYTEGQILYGIKTGFNDAFFIDRTTRDQLIAADPKSAELIKPLIVGDDVRAYHIHYQDRFLIFTRRGVDIDNYPAVKAYLKKYRKKLEPRPKNHQGAWPGRKPGTYKWYEIQDSIDYWQYFEQPKIVYPVIAREPRFAFDETEHYYTNDKCFIIPRHDLYLLALLNSRLLFETAKLKVSVLGDEQAGGRLELRAVHLQHLPIRQINFTTPQNQREANVTQAKTHYQQENYDAVLAWAAAELAANRSDTIHDLLAFLAQEMIRLHQEKQTEINNFLHWLAQYTNYPIDNWALKTTVRTYHQNDWDEFKRALFRNAAAIQKAGGPDIKSRKALTRIQKEYEASVATLTPRLTRIHATDTLIDQIVYQLYGLTAEEIAIVEGK
ncbi:MAG: hypothetical protein Kow0080_32410 [Candidatus Promineifilaceae bacterium]